MDTQKIQKPLTQFLQHIPKHIRIAEIIVFGSYLEGNATEDSDIDVFVISDDFISLSEDQRLDILYHASVSIDPEIHPWGFTTDELAKASRLTTLGYARESGYRFLPQQSANASL